MFTRPPRVYDRADRGDQQEEGRGLEGEQELFQQQAADRGRVAEAGGDVGAVGAERHQGGGEDRGGELDEEDRGDEDGEEALLFERVADRLAAAADVGDDEDVEDHHRAGVDDHLGGGDEGRGQQQEERGQREQVGDQRQHAVEGVLHGDDADCAGDRADRGDEEDHRFHQWSLR
jgi:hypothetical protein